MKKCDHMVGIKYLGCDGFDFWYLSDHSMKEAKRDTAVVVFKHCPICGVKI